MNQRLAQRDIVARAFELAGLGTCRTLDDLRRQLRREGYESIDAHLSAPTMRRQLKALLTAVVAAPDPSAAQA
ncbi:hypothetical protein [Sphingomonas sp. ID0503]|uniref:hypothetical protein n=1 Tax=Sphingomonas sp. ID0503 TaxID=3399691 RepID=UPI003AFB78CC